MKYPEHYQTELLTAIQSIDLRGVKEAIDVFREARARGNCIFVCGSGDRGTAAADLLCSLAKRSSIARVMRFRILLLSDDLPEAGAADPLTRDGVFVDQLRNIVDHSDVVVAVASSGSAAGVLAALDYANRIGCRTISITGGDGGKLAPVSTVPIVVPASHPGSVEDVLMVVCHMIGYYFVNCDDN